MQFLPLASVGDISGPSLLKRPGTKYVPVAGDSLDGPELNRASPAISGGAKAQGVINFPTSSMNTHHHHVPIQPTTREAIHQTIAARAYELWEKYRRPENQALDHWLEAERELMRGPRRRHSNPPHPVSAQKREEDVS